jgi:hypothetical protein
MMTSLLKAECSKTIYRKPEMIFRIKNYMMKAFNDILFFISAIMKRIVVVNNLPITANSHRNPLNTNKSTTSGVGNHGPGMRQAQKYGGFLYIEIVLCQQTRQMKITIVYFYVCLVFNIT